MAPSHSSPEAWRPVEWNRDTREGLRGGETSRPDTHPTCQTSEGCRHEQVAATRGPKSTRLRKPQPRTVRVPAPISTLRLQLKSAGRSPEAEQAGVGVPIAGETRGTSGELAGSRGLAGRHGGLGGRGGSSIALRVPRRTPGGDQRPSLFARVADRRAGTVTPPGRAGGAQSRGPRHVRCGRAPSGVVLGPLWPPHPAVPTLRIAAAGQHPDGLAGPRRAQLLQIHRGHGGGDPGVLLPPLRPALRASDCRRGPRPAPCALRPQPAPPRTTSGGDRSD